MAEDLWKRLFEFESRILGKWFKYFVEELADPRTNHWFGIHDPVPGSIVMIVYVYFVLSFGPKMMSNRKPLQLEKALILYNLVQVIISIGITYYFLVDLYLSGVYNIRCQPLDYTRSADAMKAAKLCYMYYASKMIELLDTIFFVLRRKDRQITFLHVYHHTGMPLISWLVVKYYPGGHLTFYPMINSMVHIVMYTYYLLSAMGPKMQKYLWWKKYLTTLQLVQFGIGFLHAAQLLYFDCGFPRWTALFVLPNGMIFYFLFNDFYKKTYVPQRNKKNMMSEKQKISEMNSEKTGKLNFVSGFSNTNGLKSRY